MGSLPLVYSYRRFSSGRQARGHSLERQTAEAQLWCKERGLVLDETLALSDLGVSAFSGDNAARGALASFLAEVQSGRVPRGSILLVEKLDRLSRTAIPEAISLLTSIVRSGVRVVSLIDGHEWNEKTIEDLMSFMYAVMLLSRAHDESSTKSRRVSAAFQKKRAAGLPVISHQHGPGWAAPRADKQGWVVDRKRASVVIRVFKLAAAGLGGTAISRQANVQEWVLPWRVRKNTSTRWEHTGVSRLLRDSRVLGEWQPKRMVAGVLTPDGEPVRDYFPRIVSDDLWHQVQVALSTRSGPLRIRGVKADVFSGLFFCSCGERMDRKAAAGRGYARYYCIGRKNGNSDCPGVPESVMLGPVLSLIAQSEQAAFNPDDAIDKLRDELSVSRSRLAEIRRRATHLLEGLEASGGSSFITQRLKVVEEEEAQIIAAIGRAEAALATTPLRGTDFGYELAAAAAKAVNNKADVKGRHQVATALQRTVTQIVWHGAYAMVHLRNGATLAAMPPKSLLQRAKNRNAGKKRGAH